ncbi:MAG: hypothetical protein H6581_06610 [Bacteroidia bacterium]|nr:hypothetical protein [Bacteroidia bacterium]
MKLPFLLRALIFPFKLIFLVGLPFFVLVRGAVFLYAQYNWNPWAALGLSLAAAGIVIFIYLSWGWKKLIGKKKISGGALKVKMWIAGLIMAVFAGYGILYISGDNAKTEQIKKDYGALHPILRMGLSTVTLFDQNLLITDLQRSHGDYAKVGLRELKNSLHFKQSTGYVHAVDLRVKERSEFRNQTLQLYFKLMGFHTLRHVGTADHLHISLMIHEAPNAL